MALGKDHVAVLERRKRYLEGKIRNSPDKVLSWDLAEVAAIEWAVDRLKPIVEVEADTIGNR